MYACLHSAINGLQELLEVALQFSPSLEATSEDTVVFSILPLRKLLGPPHQIAAEICRLGFEHHLQANLAIAANPDSAVLLARNLPGVTLVTPGEEHFKLAPLPLDSLSSIFTGAHPDTVHQLGTHLGTNQRLFETLRKWGLSTCGDLANLAAAGLAERFGPSAVYLRNLARGTVDRPLHLPSEPTSYQESMELEHPLAILEPLLFLLGSSLRTLCTKLRSQSMAARLLKLHLRLEGNKEYRCELEFPVPLQETRTLLKLLQLHLERHAPEAAVLAFHVHLEPAAPRRAQGGLFVPTAPLADRLEITLARIRGMVGKENVLTPRVLDTHRPDAFDAAELHTQPDSPKPGTDDSYIHSENTRVLRLAIRLFRPALPARVQVAEAVPRVVTAPRVSGTVLRSAGPWKTSGEWWAKTSWARMEWDVALNDGGLYRIYQEAESSRWFVQGMYD